MSYKTYTNVKITLFALIFAVFALLTLAPQRVAPDTSIPAGCPGSSLQGPKAPGVTCPGNFEADCKPGTGVKLDKDNCDIIKRLVQFIQVLTGLVGVVIIMMIIIGGIQYSAAGNNPQSVLAARKKIVNALLALLVYVFSFAFLQWLIPGGIL